MKNQVKTASIRQVTPSFYEIDPPIVLEEKPQTRVVFYGHLARSTENNEWGIRGKLVKERKGPDGWQALDKVDVPPRMAAGELRTLELRSGHIGRIYSALQGLYDWAEKEGATIRPGKLLVGWKESVVQVDEGQKRVIEQLIRQGRSEDFWEALTQLHPDVASQIADAEIQRRRKSTLEAFGLELKRGAWSESEWEQFFVDNTWIFGYGLRYQFMGVLQRQPNYGGETFAGKGKQRGDFLMTTSANQRFTVLVEIKKPESKIFRSEGQNYRSGVPRFSEEFVDAISQVQVNTRTWDFQGSRREEDREELARVGVHTISPRSVLVFGNTQELSVHNRRTSFELFRSSLHAPDIVTFDELFERAKYIVGGDEAH